MTAYVLIVEDERDIAEALEEHLEVEGHVVRRAETGSQGLVLMREVHPALVILDLMLPDMSGESVLRLMRAGGYSGPVLILSAKKSEVDKVRGFRLGADDYVTKPFGLLELLARVEALLRRSAPPQERGRITIGPLCIDTPTMQVLLNGHEVPLRPKERDLLFALVEHAGQVVTRDALLRDVWGYSEDVDSRTIDWHVALLRRKLGDDGTNPVLILTVRKVGYRFNLEADLRGPVGHVRAPS